MTYIEKFDSLKEKFAKVDTKKLSKDFAIQFTMTDEDCNGIFYIANIDGVYSVEPYDYVDNTATVTATAANIAKLDAKGTRPAVDIPAAIQIMLASAIPQSI